MHSVSSGSHVAHSRALPMPAMSAGIPHRLGHADCAVTPATHPNASPPVVNFTPLKASSCTPGGSYGGAWNFAVYSSLLSI